MYDHSFKIIILGDSGSGKTSLVNRFISNSFVANCRKSIGTDFYVKTFSLGTKNIKLYIWDFGLEKQFKSFGVPYAQSYIRGAKGGLFMYDITNYFSLANIDYWLSVIRKDSWFPVIMVGGKTDLVNEREVSTQEGKFLAKAKGFDGFIECSSKSGENVEKIFEVLTRLMMLAKDLKV